MSNPNAGPILLDRHDISPQLVTFFGGLEPSQLAHVDGLTEQLYRHGTPAFRDEMPAMLPAVPVLMDEERGLDNALSALDAVRPLRQERGQPALIVAGNVPDHGVRRN